MIYLHLPVNLLAEMRKHLPTYNVHVKRQHTPNFFPCNDLAFLNLLFNKNIITCFSYTKYVKCFEITSLWDLMWLHITE